MSAIFLNKYIIEFPNCPKTERERISLNKNNKTLKKII